jgi:phosphatidylglycerol:prolipoprotein diacylglycerol transferase
MAYPEGTVRTLQEVHPTPIFETLAMGLVALALWNLRDRVRPGGLFALYLVLAGAERLLVEFIRRNDDFALGLTEAQLISSLMVLGGLYWLARLRSGPPDSPVAAA